MAVRMNPTRSSALTMPHDQKPMVSAEDYAKARAVLDALPAGIYLKCSGCSGWFRNGTIEIDYPDIYYCERCAT